MEARRIGAVYSNLAMLSDLHVFVIIEVRVFVLGKHDATLLSPSIQCLLLGFAGAF